MHSTGIVVYRVKSSSSPPCRSSSTLCYHAGLSYGQVGTSKPGDKKLDYKPASKLKGKGKGKGGKR